MVKIDNLENQTETHQNSPQSNPPKPHNLITTLGQLLPLAPLVFEQFTGQKVPQMSGTMAEMQATLLQIQSSLQIVVSNQQQLAQRLTNLENQAVQQLTNLTHQFNSLRLTHTREKKEIAYNQPNLEDQAENY